MKNIETMKTLLILLACVTGSLAACLNLFAPPSYQDVTYRAGKLSKWNKVSRKFDNMISISHNQSKLCSVDPINDLTGRVLNISGEEFMSYVKINPDKSMTGLVGDVWTILEKVLKFKSQFHDVGDNVTRALGEGVVSEWIAATPFEVRNTGYFVHSHPVGLHHYDLYVLSEKNEISKFWYIHIFETKLWAASIASVIGIACFLYVMYRLKRATCRDYKECNDELATPSFNFLSVLGVMTGQGCQETPKSWSLRITVLTAVVMGMLISCGFSSSLTPYLAIRGNNLPFRDLEGVLNARTHRICVRRNSSAHMELLVRAKMEKADWVDLINKNCPDMWDRNEFTEKLCENDVVYIEVPELFIPIYTPIQNVCHIAKIPGKYFAAQSVFLHARSSPHLNLIDRYLMRLDEAGILRYLEARWLPTELPSPNDRQFIFHKVEQDHIYLVGMVLILMMLVSVFICVLENIWFNFTSNKNIKKLTVQCLKN